MRQHQSAVRQFCFETVISSRSFILATQPVTRINTCSQGHGGSSTQTIRKKPLIATLYSPLLQVYPILHPKLSEAQFSVIR